MPSNLVLFWVLLCVNRSVFSPSVLRVHLTLFPFYLSIRLFCYVHFVSIICSKIILFPCHPAVCISSCIFLLLAGRMCFRCFGMSCFVCIVLSCLDIFLVFLFSLVPPNLFPRDVLSVLFVLLFSFVPTCSSVSSDSSFFACLRFLICVSCRIPHFGFEFLFVFSRRTPILSQTNFASA